MNSTARYSTQLITGIVSLTIGAAVYLLFRPDEPAYFLKYLSRNFQYLPKIHSRNFIIGSFPTFSHAFAMPLISMGLLRLEKPGAAGMCIFWVWLNLCFEAGQYFKKISVSMIPQIFESIPVLENMNDYFLNGQFDIADCLSILMGGGLAYWVISRTMPKPNMESAGSIIS